MIIDHRTYALPVQIKHLGHPVGGFTAEVGNVNEIAHIRADRTKSRAAMAADRAWQSYLQKCGEFLKTMSNKMLVPTSFSPTN